MAAVAMAHGINANLLNTWVRKHERKAVVLSMPEAAEADACAPAFVPVRIDAPAPSAQASVQLQARLPNGVVVDMAGCDLSQACAFVEALGRLRCSASIRN